MSDFETRIEEKIDRIMAELGIAEEAVPDESGSTGHSGVLPAQVLKLRNWKLTLPIPRSPGSDEPKEIKPEELQNYRHEKYFFVDGSGRGVVFRAYHGGITTERSPNPRCELREMTADGSDEIEWNARTGTHTLTVEGQVNRLTTVRPHVVLAQIHGGRDDITVFRLERNKLWITKGDETHEHLVTAGFELRKRYTLKIEAKDGVVSYWYDGTKADFTLRTSDTSVYFKAGNYLQSNPESAADESTDEFSEVVLYSVAVKHT